MRCLLRSPRSGGSFALSQGLLPRAAFSPSVDAQVTRHQRSAQPFLGNMVGTVERVCKTCWSTANPPESPISTVMVGLAERVDEPKERRQRHLLAAHLSGGVYGMNFEVLPETEVATRYLFSGSR